MDGGKGIYVGGTLLSVVISLLLYLSGRCESAIFVGLWAPAIVNLGQTCSKTTGPARSRTTLSRTTTCRCGPVVLPARCSLRPRGLEPTELPEQILQSQTLYDRPPVGTDIDVTPLL